MVAIAVHDLSGRWIEKQPAIFPLVLEVKHLRDGSCYRIKRTVTNALGVEPIVFDEPQDRRKIGGAVVHKVLFGPWRDNLQGKPRTKAAAALRMEYSRVNAG